MEQIQQNTQNDYFKYQLKDKSGYFTVYLQDNKVFLNVFEGSSQTYICYEIGSNKIKINGSEQGFGHCNTLMDFLQTVAKKVESGEIKLKDEKSITRIKELCEYYYNRHKKDDKEQTNIVQNITNDQEHPVEKINIEESGKEDNNSNSDVNRIKKEGNAHQITFGDNNISGDLNDISIDKTINIIGSNENMYNSFNEIPTQEQSKKITAEIDINTLDGKKVVISFYEPFKDGVWLFKKGSNVHQKVSKKKVKEVVLNIQLPTGESGMKLKVGKISTFDLVNSETFKDEYEYKITEHKGMIDNYKDLLNNNDKLDIRGNKDIKIKILNFLFSSCEKKIKDNLNKDNNIEDTDALRQQRDEDAALYNALVKAIAQCFSFKANINEDNTNKCLSIELPYNKGQFLITINPAKKEMTCNEQTYKYTDYESMRKFIKENLYRECLNDNFEKYTKTIWNEKINNFVNDLDLSKVIGKKMKNDPVKPLCPNPCAKCCGYI